MSCLSVVVFLALLSTAISSANCAMVNVFDLGRFARVHKVQERSETHPCVSPDFMGFGLGCSPLYETEYVR